MQSHEERRKMTAYIFFFCESTSYIWQSQQNSDVFHFKMESAFSIVHPGQLCLFRLISFLDHVTFLEKWRVSDMDKVSFNLEYFIISDGI